VFGRRRYDAPYEKIGREESARYAGDEKVTQHEQQQLQHDAIAKFID
jgi:hypothetical protein